jgi:DNA-directed RNA polymerase II subunit RPB3
MKASFEIQGIDVGYVNSVRRIILNDIENVAVSSDVTFLKNDTAIHNEMMSHRIQMIPLWFDSEEIENFDSSKYNFEINVENTSNENISVTSGDIKIYDQNNKLYPQEFIDKIFPKLTVMKKTKAHILIMKLKPNETLHVKFTAAKGIADTNSKWSPVSTCTYQFIVDDNKVNEVRKTLTKDQLNKFETIERFRIYKKDKNGLPSFKFIIESECRLDPEYLFNKGVSILQNKLKKLPDNVYNVTNEDDTFFVIEFHNESFTTMNAIHKTIMYEYVNQKKLVSYCGYYQDHPLNSVMILKIRFFEKQNYLDAFLRSCVKKTNDILEELL